MLELCGQGALEAMTKDNERDRRRMRRKPWVRLLWATGVLLVTLPCLGLVGSSVYLKARQAGALSRWRSLGTLPARGVELETGDIAVVYVRTAAGSIYGCRHKGTREERDCWFEAQEPLEVDREATFDKRLYPREVEPPAGTVVDTLQVTVWRAEDAFETRYALLQDGTVYKWEYDVGSYWSLLILSFGPIAGLVSGVVVVAILWAGAGLRGLRSRLERKKGPDEGM